MIAETPDRAATLEWAVRLIYLEFAGLVVLTVSVLVRIVSSGAIGEPVALALVVMSALAAAAVFLIARGLGRRRRGARGPAIAAQLFTIASGGFLVQTGPVWAGIVVIVVGAVTGALIVVPPSTRALGVG